MSDARAFLFQLAHGDVAASSKYPVMSGKEGNAVYCNASYGPTFGNGHDLSKCSQLAVCVVVVAAWLCMIVMYCNAAEHSFPLIFLLDRCSRQLQRQ